MSRIPRGTSATSFLDSRTVRLAIWAGIAFIVLRVLSAEPEG